MSNIIFRFILAFAAISVLTIIIIYFTINTSLKDINVQKVYYEDHSYIIFNSATGSITAIHDPNCSNHPKNKN